MKKILLLAIFEGTALFSSPQTLVFDCQTAQGDLTTNLKGRVSIITSEGPFILIRMKETGGIVMHVRGQGKIVLDANGYLELKLTGRKNTGLGNPNFEATLGLDLENQLGHLYLEHVREMLLTCNTKVVNGTLGIEQRERRDI